MKEELQRRISDALDAPGGLEADADLRALLEDDADAAGYAADLAAIDGALAALGEGFEEPDWDALADRIDAGLEAEEALEPLDVTAPPPISDEIPEASPVVTSHARPVAAGVGGGEVVDLEARRRRRRVFAVVGGLAAAAAVALGVTAGLTMQSEPPAAESMAAAPASPVPAGEPMADEAPTQPVAPAPGWAGAGAADEPELESELGAAAVAEPALAEMPAEEPEMEPSRTRARRARAGSVGLADRAEQDGFDLGGVTRGRAGGARGGGGSGAGSGGGGASPAAPATLTPASTPARTEILAALRRVEPAVQRCIQDRREVARVALTVAPSGDVREVVVFAPHAGTPAEACIERAVRGARLPGADAEYRYAHPFRPAPVAGGTLSRPPAAARRMREAAEPTPAERR